MSRIENEPSVALRIQISASRSPIGFALLPIASLLFAACLTTSCSLIPGGDTPEQKAAAHDRSTERAEGRIAAEFNVIRQSLDGFKHLPEAFSHLLCLRIA